MNEQLNIIGIDPGSNNLGVCILSLDLKLNILNINTIPVCLSSYSSENKVYSDLTTRLLYLMEEMAFIYNQFIPKIITIETSFINKNRPAAVIPLTSAISIIENTFVRLDNNIYITKFSPSIIKKSVKADPIGKKQPVYDALKKIDEINNLIELDALTEHEIDAIAIAYTQLLNLRQKGVLCLV